MVMVATRPSTLIAPSTVSVRQWPAGVASLPSWSAAKASRHLRGRSAFVDEHQPAGIDVRYLFARRLTAATAFFALVRGRRSTLFQTQVPNRRSASRS